MIRVEKIKKCFHKKYLDFHPFTSKLNILQELSHVGMTQ